MRVPVLLLDDDRDWLKICLARLPQGRYALEPTTSLSRAIERLRAVRHPVVICDLRLVGFGERGGFKLLENAKTASKFTKVIVVTAYGGAATDIAREAWLKGAYNYLLKPLDFDELDECVTRAVETWQQELEGMVEFDYRGPELAFLRMLGGELPPTSVEPPRVMVQPDASIARLRTAQGRTVGTGFLVSDGQVLTCAHVVAEVLGLPCDDSNKPEGNVPVDFPLVAPDQMVPARVCYWLPSADIAGLELTGPPLPGSKPAHLITATDMWGHSFRALGFPVDHERGVWASGVLRGRVANDWLQIVDTVEPGYRVEPGFSGSPVWDELLQGVVGMVVAADIQERTKAAFLIPTDVLLRNWPDLALVRKES
jgi:ActR/RegA family two-component response regulator